MEEIEVKLGERSYKIYVDCGKNIRYVLPEINLRTQQKITDSISEVIWTNPPDPKTPMRRLWYHCRNDAGKVHRQGDSIIECFDAQFPDANLPNDFKLKARDKWINEAKSIINYEEIKKPICIIRPPTIRREWKVPSRNPKMQYFQNIIPSLMIPC